jgi:hypothetical protein
MSLSDIEDTYLEYFMRFLIVLLVIGGIVLLTSNLVSEPLFSFKLFRNTGSVKEVSVGVYWDKNCIDSVASIDWGNIAPESVKNVSLFVRNEGTVASGLFLNTDAWDPSDASEFMTLSWDYNDATLEPFGVAPITLTLQVSPDIIGIRGFNFSVIIGATA